MLTLKLDAKVNIMISDGKSKININFWITPFMASKNIACSAWDYKLVKATFCLMRFSKAKTMKRNI